MRKSSDDKDLRNRQNKQNKKLKNVNDTEAKLELAKEKEVNPAATNENKNEPAPKEDESITPSIPVSNLFKVFSVEPVLEELVEEDSFREDNDYEN